MKKMFLMLPVLIIMSIVLIGGFAVNQYFYYIGPALAEKAQYAARIKGLEYEKEKLLLLDKTIEEKKRVQATTNLYLAFTIIAIVGSSGVIGYILWHNYDKRKESWARPVDGMFALQTQTEGGITWRIDPNKTFTSSIGIAKSGQIAELPVAKEIGADRQLAYNKANQNTRTAVAISGDGQGFKYAAMGKFLAGAYDKNTASKEPISEKEEEEVFELMSLSSAREQSTQYDWILGHSLIDNTKCVVNILKSVHIAIIGAPGVGKTAATGLLVASNAVNAGMIVICLDAKGGHDWTQYNDFFDIQETNENIFHLQFAEIAKEHNRRMTMLRNNGWKTIDESGGEIKHTLVILEEFGYLMQKIEMGNKTLYHKLLTAITNLMKVSRSTGIHICIIDQTMADCPGEIKGIIKTYIAYKLNASQGNALKMYYLDSLAENGEFCCSDYPRNKFKAWHTAQEFNTFALAKREWKVLPELPEQEFVGVPTEYQALTKKEENKENDDLSPQQIIDAYVKGGSLNKTTEALFGKGKRGSYYINKIKPILIEEGFINED